MTQMTEVVNRYSANIHPYFSRRLCLKFDFFSAAGVMKAEWHVNKPTV